MKQNRYLIYFVGHSPAIEVYAFSDRDAIILACAKRIKIGKHCRVSKVRNCDQGTEKILDLSKESPFEINWELQLA